VSLETPDKIRDLQRKLYGKAKQEPGFRFYLLYDKVYREDILAHAYRLSRAKRGAAGVDGTSFEDIEAAGLEEWLTSLRKELCEKTYKPSPVRRVMIPKPGGGERPLGVPTIRDRVVQTAAKLILEPIFEADFDDSAYGYRPGRKAQSAMRRVHESLCEGYTDVVDADLTRYFDTIPHLELMQSVARRISDRHMLVLIKSWLKVPVEERDDRGNRRMTGGKKSRQGTPQGGVISPLLANIYMHRYLRAWKERGKGERYRSRIVVYADDFVILSRGKAAEALAWTRWAMERIGLSLNAAKTSVRDARRESFDFLGYTFGPERYRKDGHWYLGAKPSKKSVQRLKGKVRRILRPGNKGSRDEVVARVNRLLRGWANYFSYGTRLMAYRTIDNYVYQTMRHFLRQRHKVPTRGTRRFPAERVFEEIGVLRLRTLHVGRSACASS
jgi:RNA-directed DNA polymerase